MSNPTTPFGWQMPTSTDLVTDLPADFEVFGQAVATSMADLLGGTTGQVLKKNTNADMDFVWSADAAGMTNPMTTTGDTIYSSSGSTPARLGIGTTGQVLTVASGIPSWATPAGGAYVGCSLYMSANQSIPNDTWTSINFDSEWFDTDGFHSTSTNTSRITIPAGKAGKYGVSPQWVWASVSTQFETYLSVNGNLSYLGFQTAPGSGSKPTAGGNTWILNLGVGDYIEMKGLHKYGSAVNIEGGTTNTQFSIVYLGA
jgi:hypothetical protein